MGKIVIQNGAKWDYNPILEKYTFIEKVVEEKPKETPKKKKTKKGEDN